MGIFGTDGIRGLSHIGILDDPLRSFQKERLFSKQLCGEVAYCASLIATQGDVIIGWDRRPHNQKIAEYVIECLKGTRRRIFVLGETTTPALQFMMLQKDATLGLMITASHNPSEDTGLKLLFENGRKPTEVEQVMIESQMFGPKKIANIRSKIEILPHNEYIYSISEAIGMLAAQGFLSKEEMLVDGAGGWLSTWLAELISSKGVNCKEVSNRKRPINFNCGAGGLEEGWVSWDDCKASDHSLLKLIEPSPRGEILGFCFDGDGDRCYLICSEGEGALIVGGDGFLRLFKPKCLEAKDFVIALTIDSALDVSHIYKTMDKGVLIETGVGDKWLQHALMRQNGSVKVGAEPSGHVVLEQKCGTKTGLWGDGVITMIEFLRLAHDFNSEWMDSIVNSSSIKITKSIYPSNRELWSPSSNLADSVKSCISNSLGMNAWELNRTKIEEEDSLLLINFNNGKEWSISVRNSGTEPKTRISIRTTDAKSDIANGLMDQIMKLLEPKLTIGVTSS